MPGWAMKLTTAFLLMAVAGCQTGGSVGDSARSGVTRGADAAGAAVSGRTPQASAFLECVGRDASVILRNRGSRAAIPGAVDEAIAGCDGPLDNYVEALHAQAPDVARGEIEALVTAEARGAFGRYFSETYVF